VAEPARAGRAHHDDEHLQEPRRTPGGLIVTNEADLAQRIDAIAYPGLTANFDAGKTAALALTMLDWKTAGKECAATMVQTAADLALELATRGLPVFEGADGPTRSHQFALEAHR